MYNASSSKTSDFTFCLSLLPLIRGSLNHHVLQVKQGSFNRLKDYPIKMAESEIRTVQNPINCQFCHERSIKYKCFDCKILLCSDCNTKVHRLESTKGHKIITTDSFSPEIDFTNIKCREHQGNYCCLFCKTCDVLVCPACVAKNHAKHDMAEIRDSYNAKHKRLKAKAERYQKDKDEVSKELLQLNELKTKIEKKYSDLDAAIESHVKHISEKLKTYEKQLHQELCIKKKVHNDAIESEKRKLSDFTDQIDRVSNQTNAVLGNVDATKFFNDASPLTELQDIKRPDVTQISINIPEFVPLSFTVSGVGRIDIAEKTTSVDMELKIVNHYQTDMTLVSHIAPCSDGSLWICSSKDGKLHQVVTDGTSLKVLTAVDTDFNSMTLTNNDDLLFCYGSVINNVNTSGKVSLSNYDISPYNALSVHQTRDKRTVVVGKNDKKQERVVVIVMNEKGDQECLYENDENNVPLFRSPKAITTTSNNFIHVADYKLADGTGRVVVLGQGGKVINIYTGHSVVNNNKSLTPQSIVTTPTDNVLIVDFFTGTLHVLDNTGLFLRYFKTRDIGIFYPCSLAYTSTGQLYIGCSRESGLKTKEAMLYLVDISGC